MGRWIGFLSGLLKLNSKLKLFVASQETGVSQIQVPLSREKEGSCPVFSG